jgi:hypothetical protein
LAEVDSLAVCSKGNYTFLLLLQYLLLQESDLLLSRRCRRSRQLLLQLAGRPQQRGGAGRSFWVAQLATGGHLVVTCGAVMTSM